MDPHAPMITDRQSGAEVWILYFSTNIKQKVECVAVPIYKRNAKPMITMNTNAPTYPPSTQRLWTTVTKHTNTSPHVTIHATSARSPQCRMPHRPMLATP
jgi:hypothetical protein